MSNARGSGSSSGTSTTANDASNPSLRDATLDSGSGSGSDGGSASGRCNMGTTVEFGDTGYISTPEEVGCSPPIVQVPIIVGYPGTCAVSVNYTTQNGTALAGTDYTAVSGTASIPAGSSGPYWVNIPILDDGTDESVGSEVFYVQLSNAQHATIGGDNPFKVFIAEGPQQAANDILRWNPCMGNNASTAQNWYDVTQGFQLEAGAQGLKLNPPIQFDNNPQDAQMGQPISNAPITWDQKATVASITLNQYTGAQTINSDVTVESLGTNGTALSMDGSSNLYLSYNGSAVYQIDNNATITNMNLTGVSAGQFIVAGGTTTMAQSTSYTEKLGVQFTVKAGATVDDQSYTPIQLTAGNPVALIITVKGNMYFHWGPNNGIQLISGGNTYPADFIGVYGGFLAYYGTQNVKDTLTVPVDVRSGGVFRVSIDATSPNPQDGSLVVQGAAPDGGGPSVYMTDASSSVQLVYGDTLECDNGYVQDDGILETRDATKCVLRVGANKDRIADINGGYLTINTSNVGYGNLIVQARTLNFNGKLVVGIDATNQNNIDLLSVVSTVATTINLQANSTLSVVVNNGNPAPGNQWIIIQGFINPINGNFSSITTSPAGINLTGKVNPKDTTQYIVTS